MTKSRRLAIVGCGHVGAVTAACFAELGHAVVGVDIDPQPTDGLNRIVIPYIEPGLPELLSAISPPAVSTSPPTMPPPSKAPNSSSFA